MKTNEVLQGILNGAGIGRPALAASLGLSDGVFEQMLSGQREIPESLLPLAAAVIGVDESVFSLPQSRGKSAPVPAIWYKLRGDDINSGDRDLVLTLRQLAFYQHELEEVAELRAAAWKTVFESVRREIDPQSAPAEQGRKAARIFRRLTELDHGATGVGEVIRPRLRTLGVLVIESPAPKSMVDGCAFFVGPARAERPAIFANSYRTTWFRRNQVLMHELAHAIFDVESNIAELDLSTRSEEQNVQEIRADAFALEALVPPEVLHHASQRKGFTWATATASELADVVACVHVEQRALTKALLAAEMIDGDVAEHLASIDIARELRQQSSHARSASEALGPDLFHEQWISGRTTTTAPKKLRLPFRYVGAVLDAFRRRRISVGKAAKMLMIDEYDFAERFPTETAFAE